MSDSSSGAVELMFSVEDEQDVQSFDKLGMRLVFAFSEMVEHVEEVLKKVEGIEGFEYYFNIAQISLRLIVRSSDSVSVGIGSNSWHYT